MKKRTDFYSSALLSSYNAITADFATQNIDITGKKVLVIEDKKIVQMYTQKLLTTWKVDCEAASDGREGIESILNEDYDIILLDLVMPDMDGFETIRIIREELKCNVPVVAITGTIAKDIEERIKDSGMNGVLFKPFGPGHLKKVVQLFCAA